MCALLVLNRRSDYEMFVHAFTIVVLLDLLLSFLGLNLEGWQPKVVEELFFFFFITSQPTELRICEYLRARNTEVPSQ